MDMYTQAEGLCLIILLHWFPQYIYGSKFRRVCYYAGWASKRKVESSRMTIEDIDPHLCTHLIYAFANIDTKDHTIISVEWDDESTDTLTGNYKKFNTLKGTNTKLKTLISIGGANAGPWPFEQITKDVERAKTFAQNATRFLQKHRFDGLDIDWEFPRRSDKFTLLLKSLRDAFATERKKTGRRLLLTAAVGVGEKHMSYGYNVPHISKLVDFFNVMTYDFHGPWDKFTAGNAPLFSRYHQKLFNHRNSVEYAVNRWANAGAPRKKIVMGINTQARTYILANPKKRGVGDATHGPGNPGKLTGIQGILAYFEVCSLVSDGAKKGWDKTQKFAYASKGNQWVSYETPRSVAMKATWMTYQNLGGVMIWSLDMDDFDGNRCNQGTFPLTTVVMDTLQGKTLQQFDFSRPKITNGSVGHNFLFDVTLWGLTFHCIFAFSY